MGIGYSSEGAFQTDDSPEMFDTPKTIHGPLLAQVNGKWINIPAFQVYGQKSSYEEGNGATTTYFNKDGKAITDPMQDPRLGGGMGGTNYFTMNPDGTPGSLYGSTSAGNPSFGGATLEAMMPSIAMAAMGGFASAAAGGMTAAGAGAGSAATTGELGSLGATGGVTAGANGFGVGSMVSGATGSSALGQLAQGAFNSAINGGNPLTGLASGAINSGVGSGLQSAGLPSSLTGPLSGMITSAASGQNPFNIGSLAGLGGVLAGLGGATAPRATTTTASVDPYSTDNILANLTQYLGGQTQGTTNNLMTAANGTVNGLGSASVDDYSWLNDMLSGSDVSGLSGALEQGTPSSGMSASDVYDMTGGVPSSYYGGGTGVDPSMTGVGGLTGPTAAAAGDMGSSSSYGNDFFSKLGSGGALLKSLLGPSTGSGGGKTLGGVLGGLLGGQSVGDALNGYSVNGLGVLGQLYGLSQQKDYQSQLLGVMNKSIDLSDPFRAQRPQYQGILSSMYTDPNYFANNGVIAGMNKNIVNDTSREMAAQGYNMSGNVPMEVGRRLQQSDMPYVQNVMNLTGQLAGGAINPTYAGTTAAQTGTNAVNAGAANSTSLANLYGSVWNGSQPTAAQQTGIKI